MGDGEREEEDASTTRRSARCDADTSDGVPGSRFGPRMQLYCRTGWMLALRSENKVEGSREDRDEHTFFELSHAGVPGHVRIRCLGNDLYLAMKRSGRLYGEVDPFNGTTVFIESMTNGYNHYLSEKWAHLGFYVAIRKTGKVKKGRKTEFGQKAVQFLPRRSHVS